MSCRTTNARFAERGREDPCVAPQGVVAWTRVGRGDEGGRELSLSRRTPTLSCDKRTGETHRNMREIVHIQAGQCGNQIGTKV